LNPEFMAIVPISRLRAAVSNELNGLGLFDSRSLRDLLKVECPGMGLQVAINMHPGPDGHICDLGEAFSVLSRSVRAFESVDKRYREMVIDPGGRLENVPIGPSKGFLDSIGYGGPDGVLFAWPEAPAGGAGGIEKVLDDLQVVGENRDICLLSHNKGLSNKGISQALGISATKVQGRLLELRRIEILAPFIRRKSPGRKRSQK